MTMNPTQAAVVTTTAMTRERKWTASGPAGVLGVALGGLLLIAPSATATTKNAKTTIVAVGPARDLSTPAKRLVGHWVTPGNTHYYFAPTDTLTDVGPLTWVEVGADGRVLKHQYKIISQVPGGEKLSIQLLFSAGGNRIDPYIVPKDGQSMHATITVTGITIEDTYTYVDDRTRPYSGVAPCRNGLVLNNLNGWLEHHLDRGVVAQSALTNRMDIETRRWS